MKSRQNRQAVVKLNYRYDYPVITLNVRHFQSVVWLGRAVTSGQSVQWQFGGRVHLVAIAAYHLPLLEPNQAISMACHLSA
jgi:hypothetical protein